MPDRLRCRQSHAHASEARRDACDQRHFDRSGYAKLEAVQFAPPPRKVIREFPGVPALIDGKLAVIVFSAEEILPHRAE